jgi:hypothetical protein
MLLQSSHQAVTLNYLALKKILFLHIIFKKCGGRGEEREEETRLK